MLALPLQVPPALHFVKDRRAILLIKPCSRDFGFLAGGVFASGLFAIAGGVFVGGVAGGASAFPFVSGVVLSKTTGGIAFAGAFAGGAATAGGAAPAVAIAANELMLWLLCGHS
eukprot:s4663_g2.t1